MTSKHRWGFRTKFRRNAFGWQSSKLAAKRIKDAVSEIRKVNRKDSVTAGEGAVVLLEKLSPAIEQIDSSSGILGTAVYNHIEALVPIIARAPAEARVRDQWLKRLWQAIEDDDMPYLENLSDHWGELCAEADTASVWADEFIGTVKTMWTRDRAGGSFFKGTTACLSSLYSAGRYTEILELLDMAPHSFWHYRQWGVKALFALGKKSKALRYAEESQGLNDNPNVIATACEEILLSSGMQEEAYRRYAFQANRKSTYLATFRAIVKKYTGKKDQEILDDLVAATPGEEGKWFAAAKSAGLYDKAVELANRTPCDPKTLTRAARDFLDKEPRFSLECGLAALCWIIAGYGYEVTGADVMAAYDGAMNAAGKIGMEFLVKERVREMVAGDGVNGRFVGEVLGR